MNRGDRQVLIALLVVAVVALAVIMFSGTGSKPSADAVSLSTVNGGDSAAANNNGNGQWNNGNGQRRPSSDPYYRQEERPAERFVFDPNTADSTQLLRLGLQPWQVRNIYKYRAAGGIYRNKEDFARLYGLTVKQYRELEPYISISSDYLPAATLVGERTAGSYRSGNSSYGGSDSVRGSSDSVRGFTPRYPVKISEGEHVDLNAADTAVYKTVPGIGSYFARQIANYGRKLGGYTSVDQLDEIDQFPTESKVFFTADASAVKRININQLSLNELKRHPYINFYQARAIIDYRRQKGPINSLHELHLLPEFPPEAINRLMPYVEY